MIGRTTTQCNVTTLHLGYMLDTLQNPSTLSICLRCRDGREERDTDLHQRGGRRLAQSVAAEFAASPAAKRGVALRGVNCMSQCKRPCAIALSGHDRFTYLFGDLDPTCHAADILELAVTYAAAPDGFMRRNDRPLVMQAGILGRIPPLSFSGDLVEAIQVEREDSQKLIRAK